MTQSNNYDGRLQNPLQTGFHARTSAEEIIKDVDLAGKIAIVTGGNTGIGLETTKILAGAGAAVIVAARNIEKAATNLAGIKNIELMKLDLMSPDSIDAFANEFLSSGRPLHLLINNAGIMWVPLRRDARGIESQLATNYLAQFQLTARLWPALQQARGARVVNVSSQGHQFAPFDFDDPNFLHRDYETLAAYGQSKTAVNLFTVELDNFGKNDLVRAYSLHPGSIGATELAREAPVDLFIKMGYYDEKGQMLPEVAASLKTISQGAATTTWCATSPLLNEIGGVYCEDCDIAELVSEEQVVTKPGGVFRYSLDEFHAKRLWVWGELTTGLKFGRNRNDHRNFIDTAALNDHFPQ